MKFEPGKKRYNDYPTFFKTLFQERVQKLSIDGGFTCPNRDGSKGVGGCSFCNNESFNPDYCRAVRGITEQIEEGIRFFARKYKEQRYLAYFQAIFEHVCIVRCVEVALRGSFGSSVISGLVIGSRPDVVMLRKFWIIRKSWLNDIMFAWNTEWSLRMILFYGGKSGAGFSVAEQATGHSGTWINDWAHLFSG